MHSVYVYVYTIVIISVLFKDTAIRVGLAHGTGDDEELSEDHDDEGAGGLHRGEGPLGHGIKGYPLVKP